MSQYWHETGFTGTIARATLRTLQFVTSIILLGIYGNDLSHFPSSRVSNTDWIFATVVALLSAVTCILHCFLTIKRLGWILWDFVLCVLYAALTGVFGGIYLGKVEDQDREVTQSVAAMRAGVAFAIIGMALWLITWIQGISWCCIARRITRRTNKPDGQEDVEVGELDKLPEDL